MNKKQVIQYNIEEYDGEFSDNYDKIHITEPYMNERIKEKFLEMFKGIDSKDNSFLDIGCGTGGLCLNIYELTKNWNIVNLDVSKKMLKVLEKKLNKRDADRSTFICSDALDCLDNIKQEFDLIGVLAALHHLLDYDDVINSACKKVKEGGYFYIASEPKMYGSFKRYFVKIFEEIDNCFFSIRNKKSRWIKRIPILCLIPLHPFFPIACKIKNVFFKKDQEVIISEQKHRMTENTHPKGLDLNKIKDILIENDFDIVSIKGGLVNQLKINYKISNFFGTNSSFELVARKKIQSNGK